MPEEFSCTACGKRRRRDKLFTVPNATTGEVAHVGGNCVEPILGFTPAGLGALFVDPLAEVDEADDEDDESFADFAARHGVAVYDGNDAMLRVHRLTVGGHRYVPVSDPNSTLRALRDNFLLGATEAPTPDEEADLREFTSWVLSPPAGGVEESEHRISLRKVFAVTDDDGVPRIRDKHLGLASSGLPSWRRAQERHRAVAKRAAQRAVVRQEYVGAVTERIEPRRAEVVGVSHASSYYGGRETTTTILRMMDDEGHLLTWFASNPPDFAERAGAVVQIARATVKKHELYRDDHVTIITRAKLEHVDEPGRPHTKA